MNAAPITHSEATPAFRTVVAAVRATVCEEAPEFPEGTPDWELVQSIAEHHQIVPTVYEGLSATDAPSAVLESLREEVQKNTKRNLRLTGELTRVLDRFEDAGIRAIPYKGPVLASVAHGDLGRRMFLDLDLLVRPDDVLTAGRVLRSNGYVPDEEFGTLRHLGRKTPVLADVTECSFHHAGTGDEVELRWKLGRWAQPLNVSFAELWRRSSRKTLAGRSVPTLSPEDRLLVLCGHGSRHAWQRLKWIEDVARTLQTHDDFDWAVIEQRARSWGVKVALHTGIVLVASLYGRSNHVVPDRPLEVARTDGRAVNLADRVRTRLVSDPLEAPRGLKEMVFDIAATDSFRRMAPLVVRQAFQPRRNDYRTLPLPRALWPTYFLFKATRVMRLLVRAARDAGRL